MTKKRVNKMWIRPNSGFIVDISKAYYIGYNDADKSVVAYFYDDGNGINGDGGNTLLCNVEREEGEEYLSMLHEMLRTKED